MASGATVDLATSYGTAYRKRRRAAHRAAPQFAADAKIAAKFCPKGHALEIDARKGEPCIYVTFPRAKTVKGSRVFDYMVEACPDGGKPVMRKLIAAGFAYPEAYADIPGECLFSAKELPVGKPIRFTVTPRDCFGLTGKPLVAEFPKIPTYAVCGGDRVHGRGGTFLP